MRRLVLILLLAMSVRSCDCFRRLAGRPTFEDIQAKRELIERENRAARLRQLELEESRRVNVDSIDAVTQIMQEGIELRSATDMIYRKSISGGKRYYVVIGSYRSQDNVKRMIDKVEACGFTAVPIKFLNGCTSVGVSPSASVLECLMEYRKVRELPFCPEDSWILDVGK